VRRYLNAVSILFIQFLELWYNTTIAVSLLQIEMTIKT